MFIIYYVYNKKTPNIVSEVFSVNIDVYRYTLPRMGIGLFNSIINPFI